MENKLVYIIQNLCNCNDLNGNNLGKKVVQKICYLLERYGVDMDLNYKIHFYGPYSSVLDVSLQLLELNNHIRVDTSGSTHIISYTGSTCNAIDFNDAEIIKNVISQFACKTPKELEILTTTDYVANNLVKVSTEAEVINKVLEIKGAKFTEQEIKNSIRILKNEKLIAS